MKKRMLSAMLTLSLVLSLLPAVTVTASAYSGGSGTQGSPYQISSRADLEGLATEANGGANKYFELTQNIDLGGSSSGSWKPIENFSGTFDGKNYTISGLYINGSSRNQGLFGSNSGTIKNLKVIGDVSGEDNTGGIVGQNGGRVENCTFSGSVKGKNKTGGIVGENGGTVTGCGNLGTVSNASTSTYYGFGGIVGSIYDGKVENCYNLGTITITDYAEYAGGIVGEVDYYIAPPVSASATTPAR